jgi:hypothetical protein
MVCEFITREAMNGRRTAEIIRNLKREFPSRPLPSPRTVYNLVGRLPPRDGGPCWSLAAASADDAALVLPVLAAAARITYGTITTLTNAEAKHIAKLVTIVPDIEPFVCYLIARQYVASLALGQPTALLDQFVAMRPWENHDALVYFEELDQQVSALAYPHLILALRRAALVEGRRPRSLPPDAEKGARNAEATRSARGDDLPPRGRPLVRQRGSRTARRPRPARP